MIAAASYLLPILAILLVVPLEQVTGIGGLFGAVATVYTVFGVVLTIAISTFLLGYLLAIPAAVRLRSKYPLADRPEVRLRGNLERPGVQLRGIRARYARLHPGPGTRWVCRRQEGPQRCGARECRR